jgi:hypothetical protein
MYKSAFVIEDWFGPYPGYTTGERWNGWATPHFEYEVALRAALNGFDSFGGMAAVMGRWTPEQRQAFGERVAFLDALWQRFRREFRAIDETITRDEPNTAGA